MKKIAFCLPLVLLFPSLVLGAQVFGSLKYEDRSVGPGMELKIQCDGERDIWAKTDGYGSYNAYLQPKRCGLQVLLGNQWSESAEVFPDSTDPVRYDFELVKRDNGSLFLRRK
jgi:hypothetical protein